MAYSYQLKTVIDLVRAVVKTTLTDEGEAPSQLPLATTAAQAVFLAEGDGALPLTVIEVRTSTFEDMGTSELITLPLILHHVRELEPQGSAAETALERVAALAAAFKGDFRLHGATLENGSTGANVPINRCQPERISAGEDNELQGLLEMAELNVSVVACSLHLTVDWYEGE